MEVRRVGRLLWVSPFIDTFSAVHRELNWLKIRNYYFKTGQGDNIIKITFRRYHHQKHWKDQVIQETRGGKAHYQRPTTCKTNEARLPLHCRAGSETSSHWRDLDNAAELGLWCGQALDTGSVGQKGEECRISIRASCLRFNYQLLPPFPTLIPRYQATFTNGNRTGRFRLALTAGQKRNTFSTEGALAFRVCYPFLYCILLYSVLLSIL